MRNFMKRLPRFHGRCMQAEAAALPAGATATRRDGHAAATAATAGMQRPGEHARAFNILAHLATCARALFRLIASTVV